MVDLYSSNHIVGIENIWENNFTLNISKMFEKILKVKENNVE